MNEPLTHGVIIIGSERLGHTKAVAVLGRMLSFSRLKINTDDLDEIEQELTKNLKSITGFVPVVIDSDVMLDLSALVQRLWRMNIQPIGVVNGVLTEQANAMFLATFPPDGQRIETLKIDKSADKDKSTPAIADEPADSDPSKLRSILNQLKRKGDSQTQADASSVKVSSEETDGSSSCICDGMLRSGQSFQHVGGDLAILGGMNRGAEAITDCNLHVYGRGLGRLVAGATGDINARIFCQRFDPTLVAIAGTYCLHDDIPSEVLGKAVQVSCELENGITKLIFKLME